MAKLSTPNANMGAMTLSTYEKDDDLQHCLQEKINAAIAAALTMRTPA